MMLTRKHITALNTAIKLLEEADFDQSALSLLKELQTYNQRLVDLDMRDDILSKILEDPRYIPAFAASFAVYMQDKKHI
jgi:hypothetical protein